MIRESASIICAPAMNSREERTSGVDGLTRTTTRSYNPLGQLVEHCVSGGGCTTFDYEDSSGGGSCCGAATARRVTATDPDGVVSVRDYAEGRLVAVTAAPSGTTTRTWYDSGRLASLSDASGATTRFEYDGLGRPDQTLFRPTAASAEDLLVDLDYATHRADRAFSTVTDGDGRASSYAWGDEPYRYNSMVEEHPADATGWLSHSYFEPTGRPRQTWRKVGAATTLGWTDYEYDRLGRTTRLGYAHDGRSGRSVSWVYQQTEPAATDIGRLRWINDSGPLDPLAQVSFAYHPDGTVASESRHQLGRDYDVGYEYAGLGDVSEVTYPSGLVVRFERDPAAPNRLLRVVANDGGVDVVLAEPIAYTPAGRLAGFVAGNGVEYGLERTPAVHGGFVERVWAATSPWVSPPDLLDLSYTPDALGRVDFVADGVDPGRSVDYGYDPRGRLTSAVSAAWDLSWTYDVAGNRLTETRDSATTNYNLASGTNRLTNVTDASGGTVHFLEYDEFGSATQLDGLCFELDAADRLVRLRAAGAGGCDATANILEEYDYDYRSRRTMRRECGGGSATECSPTWSCTVFVHDRQDRIIAEHDCDTGDVLAEYVYLEGHRLLAARRGGSWYWYLGDHLGVPRKVVDEAGAVVWDGVWEPFGVVDEVVTSVPQPFRLPGQYETRSVLFSPDQHLYYNHHRWYVPGLGRYTQVDPAPCASPPGCATYAYALGDPVAQVDWTGQAVYVMDMFCPPGVQECIHKLQAIAAYPSPPPSQRPNADPSRCPDDECYRKGIDWLRDALWSPDVVPLACWPNQPPSLTGHSRGGTTYCNPTAPRDAWVLMWLGLEPNDPCLCKAVAGELMHVGDCSENRRSTEDSVRRQTDCVWDAEPGSFPPDSECAYAHGGTP